MKIINKEDVEHIAFLSRLKLSKEEISKYEVQLESILEYMEKLKEVDTSGVEPMLQSIFFKIDGVEEGTRLREDIAVNSNLQEKILDNAPERVNTYFKVEKVID